MKAGGVLAVALFVVPATALAAGGALSDGGGAARLAAAGSGALLVLVLAAPLLLWQHLRLRAAAKDRAGGRERLRALEESLAAAPEGFFRWDHGDGSGRCSRRLAVLLDLPAGTTSDFDAVLAAFAAADAKALARAVAALRDGGEGFRLELPLAAAPRRVLVEGVRAATDDGRPLADLVWMQDVTAAAQAVDDLAGLTTALAAERDRLRTLLDSLPVPVWLRGEDLSLLYANGAYAAAVEAEAGAEAARRGLELVPASLVREARALAARARAAGAPRRDRFHVVIGGARRLMEVTELPIAADAGDGARRLTAGFAFDVTGQEELQDELARHVAAHARMLENLQTAIAVFDADRRLSFRNLAFERLWHLEADWLDARPGYGGFLDELRQRRLLPEVADYPAFRQGELKRFVSLIEAVEDLLHLPDGRTLRRVIAAHPFGGLVFTYEDVTDTLALERSHNTLIAVQRETLDNLHEGVAVFGADGRLRLSNPAYARLWALKAEELEGAPHIADIVASHRRLCPGDGAWEKTRATLVGLINDRRPRRGRVERADGVVLDYASVPLPDGATLLTWMDVTDPARVERALRERNDALREANRLKSEFIASVSTEVRTPLDAILDHAEALAGDGDGGGAPGDQARAIRDAARSLAVLINDILDLAAVEAGQMALELDTFDVHAMLHNVLALVRGRAAEGEVALAIDCPGDIGWMVADERRVKQVLFNLLGNAVKFTPPGGTVTLAAAREGAEVVFTVADTGVGIAKDDLPAVFESFTRGRRPESRREGAGLGLALVKSFVDLHRGTVALESHPGHGTTVTVRLPAGEGVDA